MCGRQVSDAECVRCVICDVGWKRVSKSCRVSNGEKIHEREQKRLNKNENGCGESESETSQLKSERSESSEANQELDLKHRFSSKQTAAV